MQYYAQPPPRATYYSIDVECVAVGHDHNARAVAQIALVDQYEAVLLNIYVKPEKPVVSHLTAITGLTAEVLEKRGVTLQQALEILRNQLPRDAILVGQSIRQDVQWLGLAEGTDFQSMIDLAGLYRVWNPHHNSYSGYSQDHLVKVLLGWDVDSMTHDAVVDATKSIRLFNLYNNMQMTTGQWEQAQHALLASQPQPSFAKRNPSYDGVCMGNRKTCTCGAPFFF